MRDEIKLHPETGREICAALTLLIDTLDAQALVSTPYNVRESFIARSDYAAQIRATVRQAIAHYELVRADADALLDEAYERDCAALS